MNPPKTTRPPTTAASTIVLTKPDMASDDQVDPTTVVDTAHGNLKEVQKAKMQDLNARTGAKPTLSNNVFFFFLVGIAAFGLMLYANDGMWHRARRLLRLRNTHGR